MAKIRIGFSTELNIGSELSGIGTDNPTNTKQVLGNIHASNAKVVGVSTLKTYQGFLDKEARFGKSSIDINSQAGTLGDVVIDGEVTVSSGSTLCSGVDELTLTDSFSVPTGNTDSRIHCQTAGSMRFNEDLGTLEFYTGDEWRTVNSFVDNGNRGRAVWAGGYDQGGVPSSTTSNIDFMNTHTLGNSRSFGDLTAAGQDAHGSGNAERGIFQGRFSGNTINYITIASEGNGIDFGDMFTGRYYCASTSSSTRSITMGGLAPTVPASNVIEYVQIMTLGNGIDFGDMSRGRVTDGSAFSNGVEAFCCGFHPGTEQQYEIINIASTGNSIQGDLAPVGGTRWPGGGCANSVRGIWAGGSDSSHNFTSAISYINMASKGNAQVFGDLSKVAGGAAGAAANGTRAVIPLGQHGFSPSAYNEVNTVEFITITTGGNAQDFGDLRGGENDNHTRHISPVSDSHGGLGGY